jgi:tetratricopeptide (TPR) repeat protein
MFTSQLSASWSLCSVYWLVSFVASVLAQESPSRAANDGIKENGAQADAESPDSEELSENTREIAFQAIDQMIDIWRRMGGTETAAEMQAHRDQFSIEDELEWTIVVADNSYRMAQYLRERGELLTASKLTPIALQLGEAIKNDLPPLFVAAHHEAALVDMEFERYDSALNHMSLALKRVEQGDFARRDSITVRANYARALRKLKRFDEAEQIYVELIEQTKRDPKGLTEEDLSDLKFALAVLYADKGAHPQYYDMLSAAGYKPSDKHAPSDSERWIIMMTAFVSCHVSTGESVAIAAEKAQELAEWTQKSYGVSSRRHIEALELLAKVRVAQNQYDDAIALLQKSADLRAGLLGQDHPSIKRLHTEIDAVRKQQLDSAEPVWKPLSPEADSGNSDHYGLPE